MKLFPRFASIVSLSFPSFPFWSDLPPLDPFSPLVSSQSGGGGNAGAGLGKGKGGKGPANASA